MRRNSNVFLGAILVAVGAVFLAFNYDLIDFDYTLKAAAKFWPVLLILAGVAVLLNERRSFYNPTTALLVAFAIPLAIYNTATDGVDKLKKEFQDDLHFDWDDNEEDWGENKWNKDERKGSDETKNGDRIEQNFTVPLEIDLEEASLGFSGGAAEFHLKETTESLFKAKTLLNTGSYKLSDELKKNRHEIDFEMKSKNNKNWNFNENTHNEIFLELNTKPIWSIDMGIGAGDLDFDFSDFKIKDLEIKTGAASIKVKLGDKLKESRVDVESGVAKVEISVPETIGCEIKMDGALNSKDFDNFEKKGNSIWRTSNFESASKRIYIDVSSGLSSVTVQRY